MGVSLRQEKTFEDKCKYYAQEVKSYKVQTRFLKSCKAKIVGNDEFANWNEEEIEIRIKILKKYFEEKWIDDLLERAEQEKRELQLKQKYQNRTDNKSTYK